MPYLQTIIDYYEQEGFEIPEDNEASTLYDTLESEWNPNNRFPIWKILGEDLPEFIIWLQEQIDDEQEDITETITFPPERIDRDEEIKEEILDTEIDLLVARKELLELKISELEAGRGGVIEGIKRFIRNIFGG